MNLTPKHIKQLIPLVLFGLLAVLIASMTIGMDIYGEREHGLLSFAIVNLSGYLFFLVMPVELAFIYYLHAGLDPWFLNLIALGTAIISQGIDYLIGRIFSTRIIDHLIGRHRYEKAEYEIRKYGNITIFVFNLLPLSSPVILLAAGMLKHRIKDAFLFSVVGLVLKQLLITLIFYH
jgi:membrane protein DedA with SNARE-associated domain